MELQDYNAQRLADLLPAGMGRTRAKERLPYEEAKRRVTEFVKTDDRFQFKKEDSKLANTREGYREKLKYYADNIYQYLLSNGIEVISTDSLGNTCADSLERVSKEFASSFVGFSVLEEAMNDPRITDIYCIAYNKIFVEKSGVNERWEKNFGSNKEYADFVNRILRISGKQLNAGNEKIVDFEVYGNRGNAVSDKLNSEGIALTLRKHNEKPIRLEQMIDNSKYGALMPWDIANMLGLFIKGETNMIIAGITGSGKTTTMRALLDHFVPELGRRALVIEDTPELFLSNPHTLALHTEKTQDKATTVDLYDLIITALRLKPKYIVVGEVRGAEAEAAVEGMATGHSTIFSMHAGAPIDAVNRLVTKYLMQMPSLGTDVVERIIGAAVNFVIIQDDVRGIGRRITSITEVGYDYTEKHVTLTPIVTFNFKTNGWTWHNTISPEVKDTMMRRGVTFEEIDNLEDTIKRNIEATRDDPADDGKGAEGDNK